MLYGGVPSACRPLENVDSRVVVAGETETTLAVDETNAEIEILEEHPEIDKQINDNNQTQNAINTIVGKINGNIPREPNENDDYLKNQLIILTGQLDSGKRRIIDLRKELDKIRKELGGGGSLMTLLGFDKLSSTDKIAIIVVIVLLI